MTDRPDLITEQRGPALWLTINREARRNAITPNLIASLHAEIQRAHSTPGIRLIVLTGAGDKAFCAGADLGQGTGAFGAADEPTTDFGRLARSVRELGIPLIARVNGVCAAGGMGLMGLCDMAVAAEHSRFGLPEVKVGVFPMQVLVYLRGVIGARLINEMCLTGAYIDAARALQIGLVNKVVPAAELDREVEQWVQSLLAASPAAVRRGKAAIAAMQMMAFHEALPFAEAQIALAARTTDAEEGIAAFNERRAPRWSEQG